MVPVRGLRLREKGKIFERQRFLGTQPKNKPIPGRMAQTPRTGTRDSVGRFCHQRHGYHFLSLVTLINSDQLQKISLHVWRILGKFVCLFVCLFVCCWGSLSPLDQHICELLSPWKEAYNHFPIWVQLFENSENPYMRLWSQPWSRCDINLTCKRGSVGQSKGLLNPQVVCLILSESNTRELTFPWKWTT